MVPFTRGKERSRTSESVLAEARQMADLGYTEIQLLGQNVNSYKDPAGNRSGEEESFRRIAGGSGRGSRHPACALHDLASARFRTRHHRSDRRRSDALRPRASARCRADQTRVLNAMQRLYTREQYLERIAWMKAAKREISITSDVIVGFPGETEADFEETLSLLEEVGYDAVFTFKYSPRPNTPSLALEDAIPDEEKARRLEVLMAKQREIQITRYKKYIGTIAEVMVEGRNESRGQWIGRTSQNKTLNFTAPEAAAPKVGSYVPVRATASFPNSLVGELVV